MKRRTHVIMRDDLTTNSFVCRCGEHVIDPTNLSVWHAGTEKCCSGKCQQIALRELAAKVAELVADEIQVQYNAKHAAAQAAPTARPKAEWIAEDAFLERHEETKPKIRRDALPLGVDFDWSDIEAADAKG